MGIRRKKYLIDEIKALGKYSCVGGPFGSSLTQAHYVDFKAVPVIRGANLTNDEFQDAGFVYVSEEKGNELNKNMAFPGDIVFTQRGTLGQVALIPTNAKFSRYVVSQSQMKLTVNPDIADAYFIYSYFRSKNTKKHIESNAIVGGVPHINLGILKNIEIELPPLEVQKKIVGVLRGLDDKITLNRQINQTLEQMAQTLFKSWFVDFDPVIDNALDAGNDIPDTLQERAEQRRLLRAKADFKPLPAETRALFPSEFEETELGWVPKGWEVGSLSSVASYTSDRVDISELNLNNYISTENMLSDRQGICSASSLPTVQTVPSYSTGHILISNIRPYFKKIWFAHGAGGRSNDVLGFSANQAGTEDYLYNLLYQDVFFDFMMTTSKGSKMPRGDKDAIMSWPLIIPPLSLRQFYSKQCASARSKKELSKAENEILAEMRDTLLPKLISGELALDDLPEDVAEAAEAL